MTDPFAWWLLILGVGIGIGLLWLVIGRIPREQDDVSTEERAAEAAWISGVIGRYGGVAPEPLVEEILELHDQYLKGPALEPAPADASEPTGSEHAAWYEDEPARAEQTDGADQPDRADRADRADGALQPDGSIEAEDVRAARGSVAPDGDRRSPAGRPARTARPT